MNKKTILIAVVLVALIGGATLLYNILSERAGPSDLVVIGTPGGQADDTGDPEDGGGDIVSDPTQEEETAGSAETTPSDGEQEEATIAPDFSVLDADGNSVKLSDLRGKPVVLNFWASWCPPCKSEMPGFENVFSEVGGDIHFMMVCLVDGTRETIETGAEFIAGSGFTFPVYFDVGQEAANKYGIWSIPTTYFIDADGYFTAGAEGAISEETLRMGIEMFGGDR